VFSERLESMLPPAASAEEVLALGPRLLDFDTPEAGFKVLDAHTRSGATERRRHELVCGLVWHWLRGLGHEVYRDVSLGSLPKDLRPLGTSKLSRRVDLVSVDPASRNVVLVEVTIVRDDHLEDRAQKKRKKYADLPDALAQAPRVQAQGLRVCEAVVFALGVFGTIPSRTVEDLARVSGGPSTEDQIKILVQTARQRVLEENTWPFSANRRRPAGDQSFPTVSDPSSGNGARPRGTAAYLKQRQAANLINRHAAVKKRKKSPKKKR